VPVLTAFSGYHAGFMAGFFTSVCLLLKQKKHNMIIE
jgi:hypothetical protein